MKEPYKEVRCDHNNDEGFWTVDAWKTTDNNESGKVVAVIEQNSGNVFYIDPAARHSLLAQEVIRDKIYDIRLAGLEGDPTESSPAKRLFTVGEAVWWDDDHLSGWGTVTDVHQTPVGGKFLAGPDEIILIRKADGYGEIETTADRVYQIVNNRLYNGKAMVWDHAGDIYPLYCPELNESIDADQLDEEQDYEVDIFILGYGEETKQTITVSAHTQAEAEHTAVKENSGWGVLDSRPLNEDLNVKLNKLLCGKSIDDAPDLLAQFGEVSFVDEKIDDGSDDEGDDYVMMRSYNVGKHYVRIYYGDNSRTIGCVEVDENE